MFEFVRTHSRLMLAVMVLLIFPSFIFFGIQGYSRFTSGESATVASVDGHAITRAEWEREHARNVERARQQSPNVDASVFDTPQMKRQTLEGMIRDRLLLADAEAMHLAPDDRRLQRLFVTDPQFAPLRNPDGSVNRDLLAAQGMSSQIFAARLRQDLAVQQVLAGISQTSFVPAAVAAPSLDAMLQQREVQLQRFDPAGYKARVAPTDAEIAAYYKAHEAQYRAPEQASISYVVLDTDALMKGVTVSESDLHSYYEQNLKLYSVPEQRRASHILITVPADASPAVREQAQARAEAILAEVRKNPADFAALARKDSQDPGSAAQGGDLGYFGRGAMVKPFEDTVFAMKPGEISNVVKTDFGYHIIMLTGVRGGETKPFDAVRGEIEAAVRKSLAQKKFADAAEQFTNMVYEQPDSLTPVIAKFGLTAQTATVQRKPAPGATGALGSAKLLADVFAPDSLTRKHNTDAVEIGPSALASARVVQYTPAHALTLAEVKDRVRDAVVAEQAAALARKDGLARLAELRKAPDQTLPTSVTVSRGQPQGQPPELVDAVLRADAAKLPAVIGVDLGAQGYVVARVDKVLPRPAVPGGDAALVGQYTQAWTDAELQAYLAALRTRYKVKINEDVVAEGAASSPGS